MIDNGSLTIEALLSHNLLANTIRNDPKKLVDFFFNSPRDDENCPQNLREILEIALNPSRTEFDGDNRLFQYNNNAANVLSSCGKKMKEASVLDENKTVFRYLRKFQNTDGFMNPMFAGHFTRILECFIVANDPKISLMVFNEFQSDEERQAFYNDDFSFEALIKKMLENVHILAYKNFAMSILDCINDQMHIYIEPTMKLIFDEICNNFSKYQIPKPVKNSFNDFFVFENTLITQQPFNQNQEPIKHWYSTKKISLKKSTKSKYNVDSEKIKRNIYFLLSIFKELLQESTEFYNIIRKKEYIEKLLDFGQKSDDFSRLSFLIYNTIYRIINGDEEKEIPPTNEFDDIIKEFASKAVFDPFKPTEKMISAFQIFWWYRNSSNKNPLEIMTPLFFTEPPISNTFNNIFMKVLNNIKKQRFKLLNTRNQSEIEKLDDIYFEFMRNEFHLISRCKKTKERYTVLSAIEKMLELNPIDPSWYDENYDTKYDPRAMINGHILELSNWTMNNSFLKISKTEISPRMFQIPMRATSENNKANSDAKSNLPFEPPKYLQTTYDIYDLIKRYDKDLKNINLWDENSTLESDSYDMTDIEREEEEEEEDKKEEEEDRKEEEDEDYKEEKENKANKKDEEEDSDSSVTSDSEESSTSKSSS